MSSHESGGNEIQGAPAAEKPQKKLGPCCVCK